jgi:hypothetical protein
VLHEFRLNGQAQQRFREPIRDWAIGLDGRGIECQMPLQAGRIVDRRFDPTRQQGVTNTVPISNLDRILMVDSARIRLRKSDLTSLYKWPE